MNTITKSRIVSVWLMLGAIAWGMSGCSSTTKRESDLAALPPTVQGSKARSCGNDPVYTLNGKRYTVLPSAVGYREQGLASWYGPELQGGLTAGCETFDMHAFSAAHRSLPLPSFVRVTHLQNGKSVIVRVNDRGPFEGEGLIQLSLAAANALGLSAPGASARVQVEALASAAPQSTRSASASSRQLEQAHTTERRRTLAKDEAAPSAALQQAKQTGKSFYVVVNNYQQSDEAMDMFIRLTSVGLSKTEMATAQVDGKSVHQVRVGPLYTQDQIDKVKDALESNGLATFRVVPVDQ